MKTLLKSVACFAAMSATMVYGIVPADQDTITIASGSANAGLLETTINSDKDGDGNRINPERVYKLEAGFHLVKSAINVTNDGGTIRIVGATGGKKPVIIPVVTDGNAPGQNLINGSLELKNLHIQARNDEGGYWGGHIFKVKGDDRSLVVEDCLMEMAARGFHLQGVPQGLVMKFRNNYFRDFFNEGQQWAGNAINAKYVPVDTLIFENNTVSNAGIALLLQGQFVKYSLINHNSFINTSTYFTLNPYSYESYITNNLFYNCNMLGEDFNMLKSNPDEVSIPIICLDTLDIKIGVKGIPSYAMNAENTALIAPYDDINNYKIYVADNIYFNEATLNKYYNGEYNTIADNPVSYLNWNGIEGPFDVNVPANWMAERENALFTNFDGIKEERNILNQDPQMATEGISTDAAEQLAIWFRKMFEVPDEAGTPDMSGYLFGDFDPQTIPGIETEDGDGITKIADLIEDFSIAATFKSNIDGFSIGALHWTSEIDSYDPVEGLSKIKKEYEAIASVNDLVGPNGIFELKNYPNPIDRESVIQFSMPSRSHVRISVYNMLGERVATLLDDVREVGTHSLNWNATDIESGLYFCTLEAGNSRQTTKMLIAH